MLTVVDRSWNVRW